MPVFGAAAHRDSLIAQTRVFIDFDRSIEAVGRVLGIVEPEQYATDAELEMLEEIRREKKSGK